MLIMCEANRKITVIYCCDDELELYRETMDVNNNAYGDMVIPKDFRSGKTIVAVCEGEINILNSIDNKLVANF
jgi:uncharacterized protein (TIGR02922 family)